MKYWLSDKKFPQQKLFPDEISHDKVYLTFMNILLVTPWIEIITP